MPVPLAPFQRHAQDRAGTRPPGRVVRWASRVLLLPAALLGTATPALAAVHSAGGSTAARAGVAATVRWEHPAETARACLVESGGRDVSSGSDTGRRSLSGRAAQGQPDAI